MKSKSYLYKHSDRLVMIFLLSLALAGIALMFCVGGNGGDTTAVADSTAVATENRKGNVSYAQPMARHARFAFDPNTADSTQLLRLGLQPWQVRSIYKYRAAGGVFSRKEDFARLYGLTKNNMRNWHPISVSAATISRRQTITDMEEADTVTEQRRQRAQKATPLDTMTILTSSARRSM